MTEPKNLLGKGSSKTDYVCDDLPKGVCMGHTVEKGLTIYSLIKGLEAELELANKELTRIAKEIPPGTGAWRLLKSYIGGLERGIEALEQVAGMVEAIFAETWGIASEKKIEIRKKILGTKP